MKKISSILYNILIGVLIAIAVFFGVSALPIEGNFITKMVLSGSMEPEVHVGSLVVIKPAMTYDVGDIITFGSVLKKDVSVTHRILKVRVEGGEKLYTTKGDANKGADIKEINEKYILGKVLFSIPYVGYVIDFIKQPIGFIIFIIIPAIFVAVGELIKIYREVKKTTVKKRKDVNMEVDNEKISS